jgi:hypothetical protein
MRATALAIALLMSGAAIAQTTPTDDTMPSDTGTTAVDTSVEADTTVQTDMSTDVDTSAQTTHDMSTHSSTTMDMSNQSTTTMATNMTPASGQIVQPSNANPEEDARGIAVISAAAMVPAGWNGVTGSAVGGPLVDPATGETADSSDSYPACSATVTDNCTQTYERGRSR